jgi:hypothetical protein
LINQRIKIWQNATTKNIFINLIDTVRQGEREEKNRLVRIHPFSFVLSILLNEIIITAKRRFVTFFSIILDNMTS